MQSSTHAFGHYHDVISISCTIHRQLFSNFSPFCSPFKQKEKQWKMKGHTMAQWLSLNQNNRSVLACWYSVLGEKTGPILLPLVGLMADREASRQTNYRCGSQFLNSLQVKLFGLLISLQCYYSIATAFQSIFVK